MSNENQGNNRGMREYYYDKQLRNYLAQFMAIFAGLRVQTGVRDDQDPKMISVPIQHASKDRVTASLKSAFTQNKPIRLPLMSAHISAIDLAPETRKGSPVHRRQAYVPTGHLPQDTRVVEQRMPVPYKTTMELSVWASNQDQHYQILEQIMMVFNPTLQIQVNDEPFDWTKITTVTLQNINPQENIPAGSDRRIIRTSMTFDVPVYISVPSDVHDRFVEDIFVRVGAVSSGDLSSFDMVQQLDEQGIEYEQWFTLEDLDIESDDEDDD